MIDAKALVRWRNGVLEEFPIIDPTELDKFVRELPNDWHAIKINLVVRKKEKSSN